MSNSKSEDEWMRLPKPHERCSVTGLSRTSLVEVLDEIDPATQESYVRQMRVERHGKQRRIRLIHKQSLLDYLNERARRQALSFAPHVNNPDNFSVEDVVNDWELFQLFLGPDTVDQEMLAVGDSAVLYRYCVPRWRHVLYEPS